MRMRVYATGMYLGMCMYACTSFGGRRWSLELPEKVHRNKLTWCVRWLLEKVCAVLGMFICLCMYACGHVCACACACIYAFMYECMYARTYHGDVQHCVHVHGLAAMSIHTSVQHCAHLRSFVSQPCQSAPTFSTRLKRYTIASITSSFVFHTG